MAASAVYVLLLFFFFWLSVPVSHSFQRLSLTTSAADAFSLNSRPAMMKLVAKRVSPGRRSSSLAFSRQRKSEK